MNNTDTPFLAQIASSLRGIEHRSAQADEAKFEPRKLTITTSPTGAGSGDFILCHDITLTPRAGKIWNLRMAVSAFADDATNMFNAAAGPSLAGWYYLNESGQVPQNHPNGFIYATQPVHPDIAVFAQDYVGKAIDGGPNVAGSPVITWPRYTLWLKPGALFYTIASPLPGQSMQGQVVTNFYVDEYDQDRIQSGIYSTNRVHDWNNVDILNRSQA